jgi:predicted small secreted protein
LLTGLAVCLSYARRRTEHVLALGENREIDERRYTMFKRILAGLILLGVLGTIAGCNTMHGLGQDIERGGEKIQNKAAR